MDNVNKYQLYYYNVQSHMSHHLITIEGNYLWWNWCITFGSSVTYGCACWTLWNFCENKLIFIFLTKLIECVCLHKLEFFYKWIQVHGRTLYFDKDSICTKGIKS
jgi:hypothetical protein